MRDFLAEKLLASVMGWTTSRTVNERPDLQMLATYKYDRYQQFAPGLRFVESLAIWLNQFTTKEARATAYKLVRSRLVYLSDIEMAHLVSIVFPDYIRPLLLTETSRITKINQYNLAKLINTTEYRILLRQCLFLGLSDGANTGAFRRTNPQLSNEQIRLSHELHPMRSSTLLEKLRDDISSYNQGSPPILETKFKNVFLLDDFSASGLSYFRRESDGGYSGKVYSVLNDICDTTGQLRKLIDTSGLHICLVIYVATSKAKRYLSRTIPDWLTNQSLTTSFSLLVVQEIPDVTSIDPIRDAELMNLFETYIDAERLLENGHFVVGKHDLPHLGFDECGLPLVLNHNTPNNSLPILWHEDGSGRKALFPRITRHK